MKGIINVSIAGIAFKLDDEAYARLEDYLSRIRESYGESPEGSEILGDIEARIAEIILTHQEASMIVSLPLIDGIIDQLGAPEDISGDTPGEPAVPKETSVESDNAKKIPHRLYRNPEGAKLGGVCGGLAAYFNTDPVWVRLIFAAPLVLMIFFYVIGWQSWGNMMTGLMTTSFILYFLLWIVIPKAKTPLQKLEMKGEKITRDKLEQTFREELQSRSNDPANIRMRARNERSASVFSEIVSIVGKILLFCVKALVAIIGFGFAMAIVGILVAMVLIFVGGHGIIHGLDDTSTVLIAILLCLVVLIPLGLVVYGILKMLFSFNHSKTFVSILLTIWVLTLVFGTVIFIKNYDRLNFDDHCSIVHNIKDIIERIDESDERLLERWIGEAEMYGVKNLTRSKTLGERHRMVTWNVLPIEADTLYITPMDTTSLYSSFVRIRKGHPKYPNPTLLTLKSFRGKASNKFFDQMQAEYRIQGDTLLLRANFPNYTDSKASRLNMITELFLPEHMTVVVGKGIYCNEYYENN